VREQTPNTVAVEHWTFCQTQHQVVTFSCWTTEARCRAFASHGSKRRNEVKCRSWTLVANKPFVHCFGLLGIKGLCLFEGTARSFFWGCRDGTYTMPDGDAGSQGLSIRCRRSRSRSVTPSRGSTPGSDSEDREEKRRKFERLRKTHYNMKEALQKCVNGCTQSHVTGLWMHRLSSGSSWCRPYVFECAGHARC
jgi:Protein phosphatase inhibitor 2 (IPP-2)